MRTASISYSGDIFLRKGFNFSWLQTWQHVSTTVASCAIWANCINFIIVCDNECFVAKIPKDASYFDLAQKLFVEKRKNWPSGKNASLLQISKGNNSQYRLRLILWAAIGERSSPKVEAMKNWRKISTLTDLSNFCLFFAPIEKSRENLNWHVY